MTNTDKLPFIDSLPFVESAVWDGEVDPDPLTFTLGTQYTTKKTYRFTFTRDRAHMMVDGTVRSGRTSAAETIAVQALTKPMPWDPDLSATVDIVDPRGSTARRWRGRRNVVVSDGLRNSGIDDYVYDAEGNPLCEKTGVVVMAEHMDQIFQEFQRRMQVLSQHPEVGSWLNLPDDIKREAELSPKFVVMEEYLYHTGTVHADDPVAHVKNEARERVRAVFSSLLQKGASVGIHLIVTGQRLGMKKFVGAENVENMSVRCMMGPIDSVALGIMFGSDLSRRVPSMPVQQRQGAGRIMTELDGPVETVQFMWLGSSQDTDPLDAWLPRIEDPANGDFTTPGRA